MSTDKEQLRRTEYELINTSKRAHSEFMRAEAAEARVAELEAALRSLLNDSGEHLRCFYSHAECARVLAALGAAAVWEETK